MNKKDLIIQKKFNEWWDKIVANDDNWTTLERSSAYAAWVKVYADNSTKKECAKILRAITDIIGDTTKDMTIIELETRTKLLEEISKIISEG